MKSFVYKKIKLKKLPFCIAIDYYAKKHVMHCYTTGNGPGYANTIAFSPEMALQIIKDLTTLVEWTQHPLYQWAKKKTAQR